MRILIVDNEASIREMTGLVVREAGHQALTVGKGEEALQALDNHPCDGMFLDMKLEGEDGLELLHEFLQKDPSLNIVMYAAYATWESAVRAMKLGAADYLAKPFTPDQIRHMLQRMERDRGVHQKVLSLQTRLAQGSPPDQFETANPQMARVYALAKKVAAGESIVLILGETGTGKTVLARWIHEASPRKEKPFVTVNCPSLSPALLESELFGHVKGAFTGAVANTWGKVAAADQGTLFLDEVRDLPVEIQAKLLRFLQNQEYERIGEAETRRANVRIIAATNKDLAAEVQAGQFREDLYYRLNVFPIVMPPLRERPDELLGVAENYVMFFSNQFRKNVSRLSSAAKELVLRHTWPGNLRELRNAIEHALIVAEGPEISASDLPVRLNQPPVHAPASPLSSEPKAISRSGLQIGQPVPLAEIELAHIEGVIKSANSIQDASKVLGVDVSTIYRKRKRRLKK